MNRIFLTAILCLSIALDVHGQGNLPPKNKLANLTGDVNITSPQDKQPLVYDVGSTKWINSFNLGPIVIYDSGGNVAANFGTRVLSNNTAGAVLDFSVGPKFQMPLIDTSGDDSVDVSNRQLIQDDGATTAIDYHNGVNFPQLAQSNSLAFLQVDALGVVSSKVLPNAGTIPATTDMLAGDGSGNAIASYWNFAAGSATTTWSLTGDFATQVGVLNANTSTSQSTAFFCQSDLGNAAFFKLYGSGSNPPSGVNPGDLYIFNSSTVTNSGVVIESGPGAARPIRFRSFGAETARIQNGLMVGTTVDPGLGVVNVPTSGGYRQNNAAAYGQSIVGDGTTGKFGAVPGKVSITGTVDQTATTETAHLAFTVPANTANIGTTYRLAAWGNTDSGTTISIFPRLRWGGTGGTLVLSGKTFPTGSAQTSKDWKLEAYFTVRTTGASGTATATMSWESYNSGSYVSDMNTSGATPVASIDTTANKDLDLTFILSATTGTPHIRTFGGVIELVRP